MSRITSTSAIQARVTPRSSSLIGDFSFLYDFCGKANPFSTNLSPVNRKSDVSHLFDEMVRMHPQPSAVAYNKLLTVAVKTKHYSFALYMFDEMRLRGAPMNLYTFTIAINCYCLQKRVVYGFALMSIIFKSGYEPDAPIFTTLIKGLFLGDRAADAVNLFENLLNFGICKIDDRMISTMIDGLCKAGEVAAAHDLIRIAENTTWRGDVYAYSALLHGFCKEGMMKEAEDVLQYMKERSISSDIVTYNTLINGYCLQGDLIRAKRILDSLADIDMKPNIVTYGSLISGYCKHGRLVEAWLLFHQVPYKGLEHNRYTYSIMLHGLFSNDKFAHAWKVLRDMELQGVSPDIVTYNILLDGLCRNEEIGEALSLLHVIEQKKGVNTDVVTYNVILRGLLKKKWLHEAKLILGVMHERGFSLNYGNLSMLRNQM